MGESKENFKNQHGSKYFAHRHTLDPGGGGQKVKLHIF